MNLNKSEIALPNQVYQEVLDEILRNNLKKPLNQYKIAYSHGSSKGDNYIGIIYRIQVIDKDTNESVLNLIAKLSSDNPNRRSELLGNLFFVQEAEFYDSIYPMYKKFQEEKGIDVEKDGFHQVPFCYQSLTEEPYEGFFLNDLKSLGFSLYDRLKDLSKEHVLLVMKTIAKMHAVFFAIKDQKPQLVEKYFDIEDSFISLCNRENTPMDAYFDNLKEQTMEVINKSNNPEVIERIKKLLETKTADLLRNCFKKENTEPYATLCHGDVTTNNILFRYDQNGVPIDLRLLDFQIIRYASSVCDVVHYIFACTTKALRDKYYQEFLDTYYSELASFIKRLGSNPENLFPRVVFDNDLKRFGHYGFVMSMIVLPLFTSDSDDIPDMDDLAENFKKIGVQGKAEKDAFKMSRDKNHSRYAERMMDVCNDMVSLGYI